MERSGAAPSGAGTEGGGKSSPGTAPESVAPAGSQGPSAQAPEEAAPEVDETPGHPWAKITAISVTVLALLWCLFGAGLGKVCHTQPFQVDEANFAFFAAFIVVAGAIERFLEPFAAWGDQTPAGKADRALLLGSVALVIGVIVSSVFGLYFLEAIGVKVGTATGPAKAPQVVLSGDGDKLLRGLDVFVTALIITGGTKPLHDLITSIEKKKEAAAATAAKATAEIA